MKRHALMSMQPDRGFTLVELLVGMFISLVIALVMFQALYVSESEARANTSGATTQTNGALALYLMERDVRQAGYGLAGDIAVGCTAGDLAPEIPESVTVAPLHVQPDAIPANPPMLRVTRASSAKASPPYRVDPSIPSTIDTVVLQGSRYGLDVGDFILLSQPGLDCTVAKVTDLPDPSTSVSRRTVTVQTTSGLVYGGGDARASNLGARPVSNLYRITADRRLLVRNSWSQEPEREIASNVYGLAIRYGRDLDGDGRLDYDPTNPATRQEWEQVIAVRIALLVRSGHREKRNADTQACDHTAALPSISGIAFDLSAVADWQCYEYRLFHTVVPIRNILWRPT